MNRLKHLEAVPLLEKLLKNKTFGVIISDGEGRVVYVNEAFCDLCGYSEDELAGMNVSEIFFPSDDLANVEGIKYNYSDHEADLEKFIYKKAGSRSWVRYSGLIYQDSSQNFNVIGIVRCIDDLKNIEKNFYESQESTKLMLRLIPSGILAVDSEGKINIFNKMAEEITGYKNKDVIGCNREVFSFSSPDGSCYAFFPGASKQFLDRECLINTKSGDVRLISKKSDLLYDETGSVIGAIESFEDITEKKRIENELRKLTIAMEQSYNAIVMTDKTGIINYVNAAFERVTGYNKNEFIGRNLNFIKSGYHGPEFYKELWKCISSGKVWQGEIQNKKKDGSLYWEKMVITPVKNQEGEIINYIGVKEDISKQKRLEEFKANIEKIMRHDLKAPLTAIMGFPQVMMSDENLELEQREMLKIIYEKSSEMLNRINSSMCLCRIEEGAFELNAIEIDAFKALKKIEYDMGLYSKKFDVSLELHFEGIVSNEESKTFTIMGDETLFNSILVNLTKNAIEASPEKGLVTIKAAAGENLVITIHNQGVIAECVRKIFFEKYTTHGKSYGTGLGAYGAKMMAEAMGASIGFTTDETAGTTIFLKLKKG